MNNNTLKLTTGAMFVAIFAMLLVINQQTGMMLQDVIMYVLPIPMVAFSAKYGWKSGLPVMVSMILISVLFGTPTTIFYAATESFIGLVLGTCLNKKADPTKTMLAVILLSAVANLLNTVILASLFGYNLAGEMAEMKTMMDSIMQQVMEQSGTQVSTEFMTMDYIMRIFVISMVLMGMIQGYIVYVISLLILKKLRFPVQKPKSLLLYYPPKWTGILAILLTIVYTRVTMGSVDNEILLTVLQSAGICGSIYLMCFGVLAWMVLFRMGMHLGALPSAVLAFLLLFVMSPLTIFAGLIYIVTDFHKRLIETGKLL